MENDYTKGQQDLISNIKQKVGVLANSDKKEMDLAHGLVDILKDLKPVEKDSD